MNSLNDISVLKQVLQAIDISRPLEAVHSVIAEARTEPRPAQRLAAYLSRLGVTVRFATCRLNVAIDASDRRRGFLFLAGDNDRPAAYLIHNGRILRIADAPTATAERIEPETFLAEIKQGPDVDLNLVAFERRATLDAARDTAHADHKMTPFRRLMGLFAPDTRDISIVILFAIGVGILTLATPVAVQSLVNFVAFGGLMQPLVIIGILLFAFLAMAGAIRTYKAYLVDVLQRRIFVRVVADLAYRLPRVRLDAFDRRSGPELVNRFFDVLTVQKASATFLLDGVGVLLQASIGLIILAFYHPFLLAFDVVLVAAILFVIFVLGRGAVRTAIHESKAKYAVAASLEEIALNPLTFKQAGGGDFAWHRSDALAAEYVRARSGHFRVVVRQIVGAAALQALAGTALLTLGGFLVIQGELTLGQLVAAELIVSAVLASFSKFGKQLESIYDLLAGVDKLGQLIDLPLERQDGETLAEAAGPAGLRLVDVTFGFDDAELIYDRLNLEIRPGERVLMRGLHGSGKSTLSDLLCGARAPKAGYLELDGVDFRELSLDALRRHVAVVKELEIVEGSIADNVRLGRLDVSGDRVRQALQEVGLLETVRRLPDGLDTHLNNAGRPLSYGQSRRLMVARALAGSPRVIVLDDVLDDLDAESHDILVNSILLTQRQRTVIVTSHSAQTLSGIDRVIDLPKSRQVAQSA